MSDVAESMLDAILSKKLKTPQGRATAATYMASYLDEVLKNGCDFNSDNHRRMLRRAAEILKALAKEDEEP